MATVDRQTAHRIAANASASCSSASRPERRGRAGRARQPAVAARSVRRGRPHPAGRGFLRRRPRPHLRPHLADARRAAGPSIRSCWSRRSRTPATTTWSAARRTCLEMSQEVATAAHAEHFARIVRDKAVLRSLIHAGTDIIQERQRSDSRRPRNALPRRRTRVPHPRHQGGQPGRVDPRRAARIAGPHRRPHAAPARLRRHRDRLHRLRRAHRRAARFGAGDPGGPAEHGQDGAGAEHGRAHRHRRTGPRQADALRQPGNVGDGTWATGSSARGPG